MEWTPLLVVFSSIVTSALTYLFTRPKQSSEIHKTDTETFILKSETLEKWMGKCEAAHMTIIGLQAVLSELRLELERAERERLRSQQNYTDFCGRVRVIIEKAEVLLTGVDEYENLLTDFRLLKGEIERV